MIDKDVLKNLKKGSQRWQAERRRVEQFLNARTIKLRAEVSKGTFYDAVAVAEDLYQTIDEMVQLAGCPNDE